MTDSSDKKSKMTHESLHSRLGAIDKKLKSDDLDAMPDDAGVSAFFSNEFQDDDEAIDRLLIDADSDADDSAEQSNLDSIGDLEDLDDFSNFSDFDESAMTLADADVETDQIAENSAATAADEMDDFFGLGDDFDDPLQIQDDKAGVSASTEKDSEPLEGIGEQGENEPEMPDDFSDFSDFVEPDIMPAEDTDEIAQEAEDLAFHGYDAGLTGEADEFSGLTDGLDELDLVQDAGVNASVRATEISIPGNEEPQASIDEVGQDESEVLDDFSDFSDFEQPEMMPAEDTEEVAQAMEDQVGLAVGNEELLSDIEESEQDELSDFNDFAEPEIMPADETQDAAEVTEEIDDADDFSGVIGSFDELNLMEDDAAGSEDTLEETDEQADVDPIYDDADLLDEVDDDADEFDDSDMIQVDEVDDWADLVTSLEELQAVGEKSDNDAPDDENDVENRPVDSDSGFGGDAVLEQTIGDKTEFSDDTDLSENDSFFQLDEVSDDFSGQVAPVLTAETKITSTPDESEEGFLLPDFDITADSEVPAVDSAAETKEDANEDFGNIDFLNEEEALKVFGPDVLEPKPVGSEVAVDPELTQTSSADTNMTSIENAEDLKLSPFGFEQEDIKKQLDEAESKVKRARLFSYAALGFAAVALTAAVGLGVLTYTTKTEFSKLTETVTTLEANLAKNAESSSNISNIVVQQDMVSKELSMLQVKISGLEDKAALAPPIVGPVKAEAVNDPQAPVKDGKATDSAKVKTGTAQEPAPSKDKAGQKTAPAATKADAVTPDKEKAQPQALNKEKAQPETEAKPDKPKVVEKAAVNQEPKVKQPPATPGKWGVNLGAFKQEWFAKSKAAEYAQQGVVAEVVPVHEKNTIMFRLRVGGFKTKAEANANIAKIKKSLNLDSVWVSDN